MEQLDIFMEEIHLDKKPLQPQKEQEEQEVHEEQEVPLFDIGDRVKVTSCLKENIDPEDYYYLQNFSNKKGVVISLKESSSGAISYEVEFDKGLCGYFYAEDLIPM